MSRKVSMWIVVVLVGALAAMTAAVVVLATDDDGEARATTGRSQGYGWSDGGSGRQGDFDSLAPSDRRGAGQIPMMGAMHDPWMRDGGGSMLPWVLFAVATGTSVGLLIAWGPGGRLRPRRRTTAGRRERFGDSRGDLHRRRGDCDDPHEDQPSVAASEHERPAPIEDEPTAPLEDEAATSTT